MKTEKILPVKNSMKHPISYKVIIITVLVVISIMVNIYSFTRPTPLIDIIYQTVVKKDNTRIYFNIGLDKFLKEKVPEGNLFLKFRGFRKLANESDGDIPLMIYMRAYYKLYPRQTYVVKPGVVVNKGEDILNNPFDPNWEWLKAKGVSKVITIIRNPIDKSIRFDIQNVD